MILNWFKDWKEKEKRKNNNLLASLVVRKKIEKPIKPRKPEKNQKNRIVKKHRLNRLKFLKNRPIRFGFGFISLKPKKPNRTQTETEPNRKNRAKTVWTGFYPKKLKRTEPKPAGLNRFRFFKKKTIRYCYFFFTKIEPKMIILSISIIPPKKCYMTHIQCTFFLRKFWIFTYRKRF